MRYKVNAPNGKFAVEITGTLNVDTAKLEKLNSKVKKEMEKFADEIQPTLEDVFGKKEISTKPEKKSESFSVKDNGAGGSSGDVD